MALRRSWSPPGPLKAKLLADRTLAVQAGTGAVFGKVLVTEQRPQPHVLRLQLPEAPDDVVGHGFSSSRAARRQSGAWPVGAVWPGLA